MFCFSIAFAVQLQVIKMEDNLFYQSSPSTYQFKFELCFLVKALHFVHLFFNLCRQVGGIFSDQDYRMSSCRSCLADALQSNLLS